MKPRLGFTCNKLIIFKHKWQARKLQTFASETFVDNVLVFVEHQQNPHLTSQAQGPEGMSKCPVPGNYESDDIDNDAIMMINDSNNRK